MSEEELESEAIKDNTDDAEQEGEVVPEEKPEEKAEEKSEEKAEEVAETKVEKVKLTEEEVVEEAPESYEDYSLPKGTYISEDVLGEFNGLAKELGLSQDKAQKLVDIAAQSMQQQQEALMKNWDSITTGWAKEIKNDPEFGGDKFEATVTQARRALSKFGSSDLTQLLDDSGYGNNPEIIRLLARVDKAVGEGEFVEGDSAPTTTPKSHAEILYPQEK